MTQFSVYALIVRSIIPIFLSFFLGAWCDLFGRKPLFYLYLSARIMEQAIVVICSYFLTSPKEYLLLANLPTALAGGYGVWTLATCAFMADISPPETLAFRFGMNHLASSLGRTIAPTVGAYILQASTYTYLIFQFTPFEMDISIKICSEDSLTFKLLLL